MSRPWLDGPPVPIERLWLPAGETDAPAAMDAQGYLRPREHHMQRRCLASDELDEVGLAMLRGESGAGKTYAIAAMMERLGAAGRTVHYVDLARVDTRQALFDGLRPVLERGEGDSGPACVFFDDAEKCQLHAIERHLDDALHELAQKAVRVRIAYRAGTLTRQAERGFGGLFESASVLDLLPLTRRAVLGVLESVRQPADELLATLEQLDLAPLLAQPVTLRMITNLVAAGRQVHAMTRRQLYEQSCRLLCEPRANEASALDVEQRLAIARRFAAISVFCNRPAFFHRVADGQMPSSLLSLEETLGGQERIGRSNHVPVSAANAREVLLGTGLFSAHDQDAMGWWHASIADYLAAEYVRVNELPVRQVNELVRLSDENALILPQLEGVLGWLAADPRFGLIERIVRRSPRTLLRSDVIQLPESARGALVSSLLDAAHHEMLDVWDSELSRRIARASYPALLDDLRPWIQERVRNPLARVLAIRIAEACGLGKAASSMLLAIALDRTEPLPVRHQATITVRDHGAESTRLGLLPLITASDASDERDDLKGEALRALWPAHMSSAELFGAISAPRDQAYLGAYEVFLGWELPRSLTYSATGDALKWVLRQHPLQSHDYSVISRLIDSVLRFALQHLDDEAIRGLVADVFVRRLRAYAHLLSRADDGAVDLTLLLAADQRRALIEAMVERLAPADPDYLICSAEPTLLVRDDTQWLLRFLARTSDIRADAVIAMISQVVNAGTDEDKQRVLEAVLQNERLKARLGWFAGEIELGSLAAVQMREEFERRQRRPNTTPMPVMNDDALRLVESACAGDLDAFVGVHRALSGRTRSFGVAMVSLPGWPELSEEQRRQLAGTARDYLVRRNDRRREWLGDDVVGVDAITGLRALHLLATVSDAEAIEQLPDEVWEQWAGIVIAWPFRDRDEGIRRVEIANVVRAAPGAAVEVVGALFAERDHTIASTLDLFPATWPPELVDIVAHAIPGAPTATADDLLKGMFVAAPERAEVIAWQTAMNERVGLTVRAMAFNLVLLRTGRASRMRAINQLVARPNLLFPAVFARMARDGTRRTPILQHFDEDELAALFIEFERRYPGREDPKFREMHLVRSREQLGRLRDAVMTELRSRSSAAAVEALRTIVTAFSGQPVAAYLERTLADMEIQAAEDSWQPPTPAILLTLVEDATRGYVETSEELVEMIVESLQRLDGRLNASETPMAELLWNTGSTPAPKDETALSNLIKNHLIAELRERRLVINREVEILAASTGVGRRPDIHVVAVRPDGTQLTVYVEVKRCDNRHRGDALTSQLVQQYLQPTGNRVGVYVVGHYDCAACSCCSESRDELRAALESQALAAAPAYAIRAVVLDTRLPASMLPGTRARRTRRTS